MSPTWEERVKNCGYSLGDLLNLHRSRWDEWETYIELLKKEGYREYEKPYPRKWDKILESTSKIPLNMSPEERSQFELENKFVRRLGNQYRKRGSVTDVMRKFQVAWAKRTLQKGDDYVLLDASFGSLNTTSDLDINVVSTTKEAFTLWMKFTRAFVKRKTEAASFCEYWDSNFYYEPGIYVDEVMPLTRVLMAQGFAWTTRDTALYELACVKAYCDAYERDKIIVVDGREAKPRPVDMTVEDEQKCYATSLHFAEAFRKTYEAYMNGGSADQVRYAYLKYAVTKIEGLVSVTSLAVCKVFGDDVFEDYVEKVRKGKYMKPYISGIAAYEMLRNLRMHAHLGKYKSKYANRLMYTLLNTPGLCGRCGRTFRFNDTKFEEIKKSNDAALKKIARAIAMLLDFMDGTSDYEGKGCPYILEQDKWLKNLRDKLKELCDRAYDYTDGLIKEQTSEKKKGTEYVKELIKG